MYLKKGSNLLIKCLEYYSVVISVFAIVILSILGGLFRSNHHEFVGGTDDPKDGQAVAGTVFTAVIVYAVGFHGRIFYTVENNTSLMVSCIQAFLVFCGLQGLLHLRENRRGAIALS